MQITTYKGEAVQFHHGGVAEIVEVNESEPDGYGGKLLDVTLRHVGSGSTEMIANMHTNVLESMLVS